MYERTTKVDKVLNVIGIVIIAVSALSGLIPLAISLRFGGADFLSVFSTLISMAPGLVTGCLFIGFAIIIRLLDQIRGQGEMALNNDGKQTAPH